MKSNYKSLTNLDTGLITTQHVISYVFTKHWQECSLLLKLWVQGHSFKSKSMLCYNWRSVGKSLLMSGIFFFLKIKFVDVGRPLWREDVSVDYNCCWASPEQSLSGLSTMKLMAIFYFLKFETPNLQGLVLVFISPRNGLAQLYSNAFGLSGIQVQVKLLFDRRSIGSPSWCGAHVLGL
jgi:hypothetical protein